MKTLFFGTSEFAVPSLEATAAHAELLGVVTQPDRPAGRGQRLRPSPVKAAAERLGVPVHQPQTLRGFAGDLAAQGVRPDLLVLASYGRILPADVLALAPRGALNVHPSLLPKYRGATPIQTALRDGERETGVTVMLMDAGMDTGDVVLQETVAIEPGETYGELHDRLARIGADLLARALDAASAGPLEHRPQQGVPTVTRPIAKDDLQIDWSWEPQRIVDFVRAYAPQPAARTDLHGQPVKVLRAHVGPDGRVQIDELVAPNRGRMTFEQFQRSLQPPARAERGR